MTTTRPNWIKSRIDRTTDALVKAHEQGLTGHTFLARDGKKVVLRDGSEMVEFVSCSYLGLETHPVLVEAAMATLRQVGLTFSSARTRARFDDLEELEASLGRIYGDRSVTCFTTVTNVHLGVLPLLGSGALPSYQLGPSGAAFFIERTAHASMQVLRGILEQLGPVHRFDERDLTDLGPRFDAVKQAGMTPIVLVDGVGSMGGLIDVVALLRLVEAVGGYLYVDDAHGISIMGRQGGGYAFEAFGETMPAAVVIAGCLAKAFGCQGGYVVLRGDEDTKVLRRFGQPLIFGGPISLPMVSAGLASVRLHESGEIVALQQELRRKLAHFDKASDDALVNAGTPSPIRGGLFSTEEAALAAAIRLRDAGVLVTPAFFPTVAEGTGLIRFAVSSAHSVEQIEIAVEALGRPT